MIELDSFSEEVESAGKLASMSRHISLTALDAVIRLIDDRTDGPTAARRVAIVAHHIGSAAEELAHNVEVERIAALLELDPEWSAVRVFSVNRESVPKREQDSRFRLRP